MAQTTNMEILSFLLQDKYLNTWTQEEFDQINALPPLNSFTTGTPNERFIYDDYQSLICYIDPNTEDADFQKVLTQEPKYRLPHIDIYEAQVSCIALD